MCSETSKNNKFICRSGYSHWFLNDSSFEVSLTLYFPDDSNEAKYVLIYPKEVLKLSARYLKVTYLLVIVQEYWKQSRFCRERKVQKKSQLVKKMLKKKCS